MRDGVVERIRARPAVAIRLGRCNTVSGISFFLGGGLFTLGAVLSQLERHPGRPSNWTFLVGGFFFSTGAYAALVQEINSPHGIDDDGAADREPLALVGLRAAPAGLDGRLRVVLRHPGVRHQPARRVHRQTWTTKQIDHLIWAPEMVGCVLFLVSGHIGIIEVCHGRFRLLPRSLGWWIVIVNQLGSWLFFAVRAGRVRPAGDR